MKYSNDLVSFLKLWEGIVDGKPDTPGYDPYMDLLGYWTIGYGRLLTDAKGQALKGEKDRAAAYAQYPNGITKDMAVLFLIQDLEARSDRLSQILKGAPTTQGQFDAMLSFAFNAGVGNFMASTLLRLHRGGVSKPENLTQERAVALSKLKQMPLNSADQFPRWTWGRDKTGTMVWIQGLFNRRWAERAMYLR